jgi:hypothetical protein
LTTTGAKIDLLNSDQKTPFDLAIDSTCKALLELDKKRMDELSKDYLNDEDGNDSDD